MIRAMRKALCAVLLLPGRIPILGRPFLEAARFCAGTYKERRFLAGLWPWPYISPRAQCRLRGRVRFGRDVFIDDGCVVYLENEASTLVFGDRVSLYRGTIIHQGGQAEVAIGSDTHIQNDVQITAFGNVRIGSNVQIAPRCALYPYDHRFDDLSKPIREQPLRTAGGIVIEDDAWLGVGVIVLDGVTIGRGAVIGAGSVVTRSIPALAIAAGNPARIIGSRGNAASEAN